MAFLTLEDLVGTVEIVVFPRDYERNAHKMEEDQKVFIQGRVSAEDDKPSKLICEKITDFDAIPRELWIQFPGKAEYEKKVHTLYQTLASSDGNDQVVIYLRAERALKRLPASRSIHIDEKLLDILTKEYGSKNVKVVEKSIEKTKHMH